jgi:hypothetical protein
VIGGTAKLLRTTHRTRSARRAVPAAGALRRRPLAGDDASSLDRDDFYSVGVMGLMHAAATFDPARGASFKTFAYTAIRGAILDEVRKHDPVPRNRRDRLRKMDRASAALHAELDREPTLAELATVLGCTEAGLDGPAGPAHLAAPCRSTSSTAATTTAAAPCRARSPRTRHSTPALTPTTARASNV